MAPNAHRFVRPDWRRFVQPGSDLWAVCELYESKYSPNQPRVPAGSSEGGRWTGEGGGAGDGSSFPSTGSEPTAGSGRSDPRVLSDATPDNYYKPGTQLAQLANGGSGTPIYDKVDAALLAPKGVNADASSQKLEYKFDDSGHYLGGVTVTNEDRTAVGRMINAINGTPVNVGIDAEIKTANGNSSASFEIKQNLPPGSSVTVPWKDFGPMQGPGSVSVTATNKGSLYTGVIIGATRIPSAPHSK
ncbi:MAG: hypothetical protein HY244_12085 [Rhizobiales bacterium]|nr:hypothetical protein [Hyphomicrobiales bacterium]